jgi:YaiO family outer membrane protein
MKLLRGLFIVLSLLPIIATASNKLNNEIGFIQAEDYISDLNGFWSYSSLYYYRDLPKCSLAATINHGVKFGAGGTQLQLEAEPQILDFMRLDLLVTGAEKSQKVFPSFQYRAEAYFNVADEEFSLGQAGSYYKMFHDKNYFTYTGSAGIYFWQYYTWFRINIYNFDRTNSYVFGLRRYLDATDREQNIAILLNIGTVPDIGDIKPRDRLLKMRQKGVELLGSILLVKTLYLKLSLGYYHEVYPDLHHVNRNVTEGILGFGWRF